MTDPANRATSAFNRIDSSSSSTCQDLPLSSSPPGYFQRQHTDSSIGSASDRDRRSSATKTPESKNSTQHTPFFHSRSKSSTTTTNFEPPARRTHNSQSHSFSDSSQQSVPMGRPRRSLPPSNLTLGTQPSQVGSFTSPELDRTSSTKPSPGLRTPTSPRHDDYRRYSGTVNHYGRHSNDWLFGGFSVRDSVRDGIDRFFHHEEKERR
jgi:hypothetical protein